MQAAIQERQQESIRAAAAIISTTVNSDDADTLEFADTLDSDLLGEASLSDNDDYGSSG